MEKLELKHLAPYLPYDLKFWNKDRVILRMDKLSRIDYNVWAHVREVNGQADENDFNYKDLSSLSCCGRGYYLKQIKPILRPMPDLTLPCLDDGETPLVELAKIATRRFLTEESTASFKVVRDFCIIEIQNIEVIFSYTDFMTFTLFNRRYSQHKPVMDQLELFQYLFEHHFDVFGLIEKGLAINMNTLMK